MKPSLSTLIALGTILLLATGAQAHDAPMCGNSVAGTWLQSVFNPDLPFPPFHSLVSLHRGGTATETNTTLHPNSPPAPGGVPPITGSDGHGAWKRRRHLGASFRVVKFTFDTDGLHNGFLEVKGHMKMSKDGCSASGESAVTLFFGPDMSGPGIPIGTFPFEAVRIGVE